VRTSTLFLALSLSPLLACPRPTDTEASPAGAAQPEQTEPSQPSTPSTTDDDTPVRGSADESATGAEPPSADTTLKVDRTQSTVGFAVARATVGHVGKFEDFDASLTLADGSPVAFEIAVKTGSVVADRSGLTSHLKGADFFAVDKFPTATFTASEFTPDPESGPDAYRITGTMRLHGVGRKLEFPATLEIGSERVVGRATLDISAKAFGIDYEGMEAELAEDAVQLEIELVFTRVAGP
jgi:polyisoprenoid-binding protein YceI